MELLHGLKYLLKKIQEVFAMDVENIPIFTEDAVTVLGIYYKIQSFFFILLLGFQQVLLPLFSYHYGAGDFQRNREILKYSMMFSVGIMAVATGIFFCFLRNLYRYFLQSLRSWQLVTMHFQSFLSVLFLQDLPSL